MADLLLRDAESHEMRLSPEELTEGARDGRITDDWQVWHVRGERWIAIASHPVYRRSRPVVVKEPESPPRRSGELALIYPDNYRARATPAPVQTREFSDPTIPVLRPEEIALLELAVAEPPVAVQHRGLVGPLARGALQVDAEVHGAAV